MKLSGVITLSALTLIILSNGISGAAFAQISCGDNEVIVNGECVSAFDELVKNDLGITTDLELYGQGSTIKISGKVNNYENLSSGAVTMIILSPTGSVVQIAQLIPASDGSFSTEMVADGIQWKTAGDYTISANYGPNLKSSVAFEFTGGTGDTITGGGGTVAPPPEPDTPEPPPPEPDTPEPPPPEPTAPVEPSTPDPIKCGAGTEIGPNGVCVPIAAPECPDGFEYKDGVCVEISGCLIATAAYGTELAPQVQLLREIRDNTLFSTTSGTSFMLGFNTIYYSFAPTVADWERENPMFKEAVKTVITPMLSTLSIMSLADQGSEAEVLGFGISVIALNLGMYIAAPALIGFKVSRIIKSRK